MRDFRFFAFRDTPQAGVAIEAAAKAANVSLSGWLREAARRHLPDNGALPPLPPSKPRRPVHVPDADVAAVASLMAAVNRLNGAMIQLSKGLRESGFSSEHRAMESALQDVSELKAGGVNLFRRLQE